MAEGIFHCLDNGTFCLLPFLGMFGGISTFWLVTSFVWAVSTSLGCSLEKGPCTTWAFCLIWTRGLESLLIGQRSSEAVLALIILHCRTEVHCVLFDLLVLKRHTKEQLFSLVLFPRGWHSLLLKLEFKKILKSYPSSLIIREQSGRTHSICKIPS